MTVFLLFTLYVNANILQDTINKAPIGATLKLQDGIYNGNIVINKPLTIIGVGNNVIIKGEDKDIVVTINAHNVTLKNLTITNSGSRIEKLDSAIFMNKIENCTITKCKILNSLYGIDMNRVKNCTISNNYITSKDNPISLKGDALKVWYSSNNIIKNNIIEYSKDIKLTFAHHNRFINNTIKNNRFGIAMERSDHNIIEIIIFLTIQLHLW